MNKYRFRYQTPDGVRHVDFSIRELDLRIMLVLDVEKHRFHRVPSHFPIPLDLITNSRESPDGLVLIGGIGHDFMR